MISPLTTKDSSFGIILGVSVAFHAALLGSSALITPPPQYAVERAPSSMEIMIIKETSKPLKKILHEKIMTTPKDSQNLIHEKKREEVKPEKSIYIPPVHGARVEAKPDYLKNPAPIYPQIARENGWEGSVLLKVFVQTTGIPSHILVEKSSGYKILDNAALKAVSRWKFLPTQVGGMQLASWVKIPVRFILVED